MSERYESAKKRYEAWGVDVEAALTALKNVPISVHCWQGDDVIGLEGSGRALSGGIQTTGNYPGRARTFEELKADFVKAMSLVPGKKRISLHASYAIFAPGEQVERIYINFCNPWPAAGHHKRRLTHTRQLLSYKPLLAPGGEIWFKTDNDDLYLATRRYLAEAGFAIYFDTRDLHAAGDPENILTEHELRFTQEGIPTKALKARLLQP